MPNDAALGSPSAPAPPGGRGRRLSINKSNVERFLRELNEEVPTPSSSTLDAVGSGFTTPHIVLNNFAASQLAAKSAQMAAARTQAKQPLPPSNLAVSEVAELSSPQSDRPTSPSRAKESLPAPLPSAPSAISEVEADVESRLHSVLGAPADQESDPGARDPAGPDYDDSRLSDNEQDQIIKQVLEQGIDLRQYSRQIEQELVQVEQEHVMDYVKQSRSLAALQGDIKACDTILERMEKLLSTFQSELGSVSREILAVQERSKGLALRVKNRAQIQRQLKAILDGIVLGPDLLQKICEGEVTPFFLDHLREVDRRMVFLRQQQGKQVRAFREAAPEFERLRLRASEKLRDFFVERIRLCRQANVDVGAVQRESLLRYRDAFGFLFERYREVATEVRQNYVLTMGAYYSNAFYRYFKQLLRTLQPDGEGRFEAIGSEDPPKALVGGSAQQPQGTARHLNVFSSVVAGSVGLLSQQLGANPAKAPGAGGSNTAALRSRIQVVRTPAAGLISTGLPDESTVGRHTIDALFKTLHHVWINTASSEYVFCHEFFVAPIQQREQAVRVANKRTRDQAALAQQLQALQPENSIVLWTEVTEPTQKYLIGSLKAVVSESCDAVGLLLCIRLNALYALTLQKRRQPILENYLDALNLMLWPRFQALVDQHIRSVHDADARRLIRRLFGPNAVAPSGTPLSTAAIFEQSSESQIAEAVGPHYITRRFAEFTAIVLQLNDGFADGAVQQSLVRLRGEFEHLLQRISDEIPAVATNSGQQRYRTMFLINNLDLVATVLGAAASTCRACEQERHYFLDKIENLLYSGKFP